MLEIPLLVPTDLMDDNNLIYDGSVSRFYKSHCFSPLPKEKETPMLFC